MVIQSTSVAIAVGILINGNFTVGSQSITNEAACWWFCNIIGSVERCCTLCWRVESKHKARGMTRERERINENFMHIASRCARPFPFNFDLYFMQVNIIHERTFPHFNPNPRSFNNVSNSLLYAFSVQDANKEWQRDPKNIRLDVCQKDLVGTSHGVELRWNLIHQMLYYCRLNQLVLGCNKGQLEIRRQSRNLHPFIISISV